MTQSEPIWEGIMEKKHFEKKLNLKTNKVKHTLKQNKK